MQVSIVLSVGAALGIGRVAVTFNGERPSGPFDVGQVIDGEVHVRGGEVLLQTSNLGGTRYRHDPRTLGKQPGQRDLGSREDRYRNAR